MLHPAPTLTLPPTPHRYGRYMKEYSESLERQERERLMQLERAKAVQVGPRLVQEGGHVGRSLMLQKGLAVVPTTARLLA